MKINSVLTLLNLRRLKALLRRRAAVRRQVEPEPALRADLFSAEQMEGHGVELANQHRIGARRKPELLLARLADNETVLLDSCEMLTAATLDGNRVTPAAEWLLDNYYLIEEQIRTAQKHLPKGYSRQLPRLANGPSAGLPRVYDIALAVISHGDGRVDGDNLSRFVASYQTVTPLTLGELWAVPIMLRLALIENLRRVAARVMADLNDRSVASSWADRMMEVAERDPKSVVLTVADMARSNPPMASSFIAELARRLQGQSPALALPLSWIEQRLAEAGLSIEHLVQLEAQQQAADQVSIGNSIGSLRTLSATDWRDFVEGVSKVDHVLQQDPAGVYMAMDFATRDDYRHVIESLAKHSSQTEDAVAREAVELARAGRQQYGAAHVQAHVGFYLVDKGLSALERRTSAHRTLTRQLQRLRTRAPLPLYLGMISLLTVLFARPLIIAALAGDLPTWALATLAVPALIATSQLATELTNWLVTLTVVPRMLPRLDYSAGIPARARTLVAIPSMLGSEHDIDELAEALEVRYLANRDDNLHFALLTDFMDAADETLESDAALTAHAHQLIDALNAKYPTGPIDRFFLFHRPRCWNPLERTWMGFERKRGKISDLNALLRGHGRERFSVIAGNVEALIGVQYVITLDTDTQLPRESARKFVGAMAHPLNRAVYDPKKHRVVSGHAILQPRVGISLPSTARSAYARLFGSEAGIDPYTRTVSDVYQDMFGEGSFIGKGIYAVDAFEQAIEGRFPDNTILSHDLVEGCYARSALLSDVQLYEEYPSRYSSDVNRRHRWIRGDWQLLPWLLPWAPRREGGYRTNPLGALSRWKILDNLRRSLVPISLLVLLAAGWLVIPQAASWTLALLALMFILPVLASLLELFQKPHDVLLDQHLAVALRSAWQHVTRALLALAWLPHEALYSLDAIGRTLWRMAISRRRLLQWSPSREVERSSTNQLPGLIRMMWIGPALAVVLAAWLAWRQPELLALAAPFLVLWLISPALAFGISKPPQQTVFDPVVGDLDFLRTLSRKTWAFFETFVSAEDHWLPPDNVQEQPVAVVAHRTSPTNIGLALLANLAAYDFGYVSIGRLLRRTGHTLDTMHGLRRHRGHFYNWYDTLTLEPLGPRYVSTVDSGNLAGHLLTLRPGLLSLADEPLFDVRQLHGLRDTARIVQSAWSDAGHDGALLRPFVSMLEQALAEPPIEPAAAFALARRLVTEIGPLAAAYPMPLEGVADEATVDSVTGSSTTDLTTEHALDDVIAAHVPATSDDSSDAAFWLQRLQVQCRDLCAWLEPFAQWPHAAVAVRAGWPTLRDGANLDAAAWPGAVQDTVRTIRQHAADLVVQIERWAELAGALAIMDFHFLYDGKRDLLSIGYNVEERRLDASFYDLLASEARLANFVAIAQGQLPQESWFTLGRLLTITGGEPVLLSWTGSMFEYLMPLLVMPTYAGTLLDQTCRAAVARQIEYGKQLGLAWGVSESGYNTLDTQRNYQYRAFGVPGLGLKRGLGDDVVMAPYASVLALMVAPEAACRNLQRWVDEGVGGRFGLYEAVDYTPARLPRGQSAAVIYSFMAHHQGMSLLSLAYVLLNRPMQRRFESDPQFQATTLLLQERIPKTAAEYLHASGFPALKSAARAPETKLRVFTDPGRSRPAVQLLSNGRYHVMVSSGGGGYSRCRELAVTRWREDISADNWGVFCYLRDVASGEFWSTAHQPTLRRPEVYEAIFSDARAEFRVRERDYDAHTEIVVSPEDDIELRRIRITNRARVRRTIELTSYAEVVLAPSITDAMHPAFSNLFVQTELIESLQAIVCTRRPRASHETVPWMCHLLAVHEAHVDAISYETDRARFIGRGRSVIHPAALDADAGGRGELSNSQGSVLDPIVAIRCRITLDPGQSALVDMVTGVADSREGCLQLIGKYRDKHLADRVFDLAWTHGQVLLRQLNASLADAHLYEQMASSVIYANASLRAGSSVLDANQRGQSGLWGQSISGDLPIVLLQIGDPANIELVRQLVQAHAYWRLKGLPVDLLIWNEDHVGYRQHLQDLIMGLIASGIEANLIDRPGGIYVRPAQQISSEDRILIQSVARVIISDARGSLAQQVRRRRAEASLPRFDPARLLPALGLESLAANDDAVPDAPAPLLLPNPYGGFNADGSEYVITLEPGRATPAPWSNVLANPQFGTVVSESGGAYTWGENAHEFRLTPWHNDPVSDPSGEALYIRDENTGRYWSPTPLPRRGEGDYVTRHGFGYSVFEHEEDGIYTELWVYVALDAPIKFSVLKIRNRSGRARQLSATGYVEWVLGDLRTKTAMHVITESDPATGALLARNAYNTDFPGRVAFFDADHPSRRISGDRSEFLGRNGSLNAPAAMAHDHRLSGRIGAGLDPCAAIQLSFDLDDGDEQEVIFRLGLGHDAKAAVALVQQFRGVNSAANALEAVRMHWHWTLGKVQVETPDPAINVLVNGWLMYQTIACRFWARSGYYQSGGAFGFRDQLQDSMAMMHAFPFGARQQLLLCAAHQFPEGDVQHWWHPPLDRGVRTHCSDDYLWLPLAASRYVRVTGDAGVLNEQVNYIEGRPVSVEEESYYDLPAHSNLVETLYQHCVRAIEHSMPRGVHGLPLIGSGDWNDGMNRVGERGQGESVWLGFFLHEVLRQFADTARGHDDAAFAARCEAEAATLRASLDTHAWDGAWYRRAWFDDGTPLGSAGDEECQIDAIAQSWSVLSGAASDERQAQAMESLDARLVRRDIGLIQLLDPPFDHSNLDPGYIKGYVPGVRENGGQYTHAAIWATMAFAELGDSARAWELLRMINPLSHGSGGRHATAEPGNVADRAATAPGHAAIEPSRAAIEVYKVEPYVVTADVYAVAPHEGRGGWSWYTGSAGWMYRLIVESLLGLQLEGERLRIAPVLPADWPSYKLHYRFRETDYHVTVEQVAADADNGAVVADQVMVDGVLQSEPIIALSDDGRDHTVLVRHRARAPRIRGQ